MNAIINQVDACFRKRSIMKKKYSGVIANDFPLPEPYIFLDHF